MKRCTSCILPATFPGIQFDEQGLCQYCRKALTSEERRLAQKNRLRAKFENLADQVRNQPGYHCLMSWSGGKYSTYTLWLLKERYDLNILAFTFDNGFISPEGFKNMRVVSENLGIDHIIIKPRFDLLRQLFRASLAPDIYPPRALERASGICNTCMALAKGMGLRIALEKKIPILAYGWSPGQIPLPSAMRNTNARMLNAMLETAKAPLKAVCDEITVYFPERRQIEEASMCPYKVSPLAFLDYDEEAALHQIDILAWEPPPDTDPQSTNCLLNSFANVMHQKQMSYHPYVMELANLVREGYISRGEALKRLGFVAIPEVITAAEVKLGLAPTYINIAK